MEIEECLEPSMGGAEPCGAYTIMKRWYWQTSAQAPNTSQTDMEKVRGDFQTIYQREEPHPHVLTRDTHVDLA